MPLLPLTFSNQTVSIELEALGLRLRPPLTSDFSQWQIERKYSRDFLQRWEPKWPADDLTRIGFRRRLKSYQGQLRAGTGYTFFLVDRNEALLGGVSLTRVERGCSASGTLGYWMTRRSAGKGYMQAAVTQMLHFAFTELRLERVTAATLPSNARSIHLLKKLGFTREGLAREYLEINGRREDHLLFAILKSEHNQTPAD